MFSNILPYESRRDMSRLPAHRGSHHRGYGRRSQRLRDYSVTRALRSGARRMRTTLDRSLRTDSSQPSMSWWE